MQEVRDGARVWIKSDLPTSKTKHRMAKDKGVVALVKEKLGDVRMKAYLVAGVVLSLISVFDVPKGKDDIRLVYNGSSSGLNDAVWAPWFSLPTVDSHLRAVDESTFMSDNDVKEMFLNFMMDPVIRPYSGVDLTTLFPEEVLCAGLVLWVLWERLFMGFRPSPYLTTRDMMRLEPRLRGARDREENVFRWHKVILNLPGNLSYDPSQPRVYKVRKDGTMASDLFIYMDDFRATGPSKRECWQGSQQIGSRLSWFGLQNASSKRTEASQTPEAWAGTVIHTDGENVMLLVSQEKWEKTQRWIQWLSSYTEVGEPLPHKELERCRGFLIYVSRTYKPFVPYLRGLHLTLESWRDFRDKDGWKLVDKEIQMLMAGRKDYRPLPTLFGELERLKGEARTTVVAAPRLKGDVDALSQMTRAVRAPKVVRRSRKVVSAHYGLGDASGKGFGNGLVVDGVCHMEYGNWDGHHKDDHSNVKELTNLVIAVENAYAKGLLVNAELFLCTDNFVAESTYYKGGSNKNSKLNGLIFRLWNLQMKGNFRLHVIHIAGTRMIESGIDGLSRGDKAEGIALGKDVLQYVPLNLFPFDRSLRLLPWVKSWWDPEYGPLTEMTCDDWFEKTTDGGNFLWNVPPAAGEVAVEQLCTHRHRRPDSMHVFIIPRLYTSQFRKQLLKVADLELVIQPDHAFWTKEMHEPLLIAFCFPLLPHDRRFAPWRLKETELVDRVGRYVRRMQQEGDKVEWDHLRKLLFQARTLPSMPDGMARQLLQTTSYG